MTSSRLSSEFRTKFQRGVPYPIFADTRIPLQHNEGSLYVKNDIDPFSYFDRNPTCDRQTDVHRTIAYTVLA